MRFRAIVASNVKRLRLRNGWTQGELADYLHRHKQTVWAIEAGRYGINDRLMDDLAGVFQVPYWELVKPTPPESTAYTVPGTYGDTEEPDQPGYAAESPGPPGQGLPSAEPFAGAPWVREWIRLAATEAAMTVLRHHGCHGDAPEPPSGEIRKGQPKPGTPEA